MSEFEQVTVLMTVLGFVLNVVVAGFVLFQLVLLRRQVSGAESVALADNERVKKQATIEFYAITMERFGDLRKNLPNDRDREGIAKFIRSAEGDERKTRNIMTYLGALELLATSVNVGAFDIATVERLAGGRLRALAINYRPWIEGRRQLAGEPKLYREIDVLVASLTSRLEVALSAETAPAASIRDSP